MEQGLPLIHLATRITEYAGVGIIIIGAAAALAMFLMALMGGDAERAYRDLRSRLGRSILLGLEFLVAADIIATVAIEPTLESVLVLGGIVLIRTFLSVSLEVEIDGRWPWQKARTPNDEQA